MRAFLRRALGRSDAEMTFLDHLEELRRVIVSCLVAIAITGTAAYFFSDRILEWIVVGTVGQAQFLHPMEAFSARIKIALLVGFGVGLPFIAFEIWRFVVPGLVERERRIVMPLVFFSVVLFLGGVVFAYLVLVPTMLKLLMSFGTEHVRAQIALEFLLDFVLKTSLASGLLFELPLVVAVLTLLGIVSPRFLWSKWRHAVVIILILAAVVTPGDGPSQLILAAPIVLLYFLSIVVSLLIYRDKSRRAGTTPSAADPPGPAGGSDDTTQK